MRAATFGEREKRVFVAWCDGDVEQWALNCLLQGFFFGGGGEFTL